MSKENIKTIVRKVDVSTYINLKRNCIARGMPFNEVINGDFPRLNGWLHKNVANKINIGLLEEYDDLVDSMLTDENLKHPTLRTSYTGERAEEQKLKIPKVEVKEPVVPKEKDDNGIIKGTKKSYVISLVQRGYDIAKVIHKTQRRFPDAKDKSIKIWARKALKDT